MAILVIADRDGTLIEDMHYIAATEHVKVIKGVKQAFKLLEKSKVEVIVATNQSGVGRGFFEEECVGQINRKCQELIDPDRKVLRAFFYCKHKPQDLCNCRKPLSGMVDKFLQENSEKYERVYVIGDRQTDIELGINLQASPILVLTGKGNETYLSEEFRKINHGLHIAKDFYDAVKIILLDIKSSAQRRD